jgi:hypothetical protein
MSRLREWFLDWLDRSNVKPSERKIDDPLTILQRIFATLAGIVAVLSSPAINVLVPNVNANAVLLLRFIVTLSALAVLNYVVTAKDTFESVSGFKSQTVRSYRFSNTERLIARGVTGLAILLLAFNILPAPKPSRDCDLMATITWQSLQGMERPLFLSLVLEGREERYPVEDGKPVAMQVPSAHLSNFSIALVWSNNSRSDFGNFSGCSAVASKGSRDGRATLNLAGR